MGTYYEVCAQFFAGERPHDMLIGFREVRRRDRSHVKPFTQDNVHAEFIHDSQNLRRHRKRPEMTLEMKTETYFHRASRGRTWAEAGLESAISLRASQGTVP